MREKGRWVFFRASGITFHVLPMHRFYLPPVQTHNSILTLTGREAHHGLHVLRLREGARVVVLDGAGHEFLCELRVLARDSIKLAVLQKHFIEPLPYQITLLQAVPKAKIIETIIQKATELGAFRIVPLLSERVRALLDAENVEGKLEKWRVVAIEASKQCGSAWLPQIEAPVSPKDYLARGEKFELPLIASLQPDGRHLREFFQAFYAEHGRLPRSVCIWVGPEGDFTSAEMGAVRSAGALPITLGRLVLRSETAAIYCLSILNHELQAASP
jgi:16S rRNA (uracil1498-N3)-methyltransferase